MSKNGPSLVVVHPIVLLSVVDHFNRVASKKRVVGVLLGTTSSDGRVEVLNSYAVPFEENAASGVWFLDHNFHEEMWAMFKKVSANEKVIGWYSTGPKIQPIDLEIHELLKEYCPNPVYTIIDVEPKEIGIPTKAYIAVEEVSEDSKQTQYRFQHINSIIGALEAEEVGVEHLLRDVKDSNISTLASEVENKILALRSLKLRLGEMAEYINNIQNGLLPVNHGIIYKMQEIFNHLPNLSDPKLAKSFLVETNDMMLVIYVASIIKSIAALHDLINNKLEYLNIERENEDKEKVAEQIDTPDVDDVLE
eukprot:TRINITY_DN4644_c0_g1_i1.p1 TRINITY_DN4644_c0_g1~~TRINITY_DN4644_c0_g1_i1.p1  ORF type:complete len:307 (-),score=76.89 TRINITY_DN4644_c0_g1_i1:78-998(-)